MRPSTWRQGRTSRRTTTGRTTGPLGITCAALYAPELGEPITWHGTDETGEIADRMNSGELTLMVRQLEHLQQQRGFTIVTWNGLGFDFDVLAEESGQMEECRQLALEHLDLMFHFFCKQGYPLGLSAAAAGMGVEGKTEGMDGKLAVQMWEEGRTGERDRLLRSGYPLHSGGGAGLRGGQKPQVDQPSGAPAVDVPAGWLAKRPAGDEAAPARHRLDERAHTQGEIHRVAGAGRAEVRDTWAPA